MTGDDATASAPALAQAHRTITEAAQVSKRTIAAQRRILRTQMQALERLEKQCAALGIELSVEMTQPPKEAQSDAR